MARPVSGQSEVGAPNGNEHVCCTKLISDVPASKDEFGAHHRLAKSLAELLRTGQSLYQAGLKPGEARIGVPGTGGRDSVVVSGYPESSNVDLAQESTSMILAQRGFQASSRVITTADEMLQGLVNLAR